MRTAGLVPALAWALWALATVGCEPDVTVCELPEELNTCEGDGDCLLVYCGVSCCPCEQVASKAQFDETYCMAEKGEGFEAARRLCQEARDTVCDDVSCSSGAYRCPHPTRAACEGGRCVSH